MGPRNGAKCVAQGSSPRLTQSTGNVSKSFNNSYFEYFLEENIDELLNEEKKDSELSEILN